MKQLLSIMLSGAWMIQACAGNDFQGSNAPQRGQGAEANPQPVNRSPGGNPAVNPSSTDPNSPATLPTGSPGGDSKGGGTSGDDKKGGGSALPWIIGGVAAVGGIIAIAGTGGGDHCKDSEVTAPKGSDPTPSRHMTPFDLAFAGYRGELPGLHGYATFCNSWNGNEIDENNVVEAGIAKGVVERSKATCEYRSYVKSQVQGTCH